MLTPATCWYFVFAFRCKNPMNKKAMIGNFYEIRSGMFKGRSSDCEMDGLKNGKIRVLLVEDHTPLAMMMVFALTRADCDVDAVHTGEKAMKLATERKFDVITLDITLPDGSGFDLCSELKQRHISRNTPIIFISASPSLEDIAESQKRGAVDYITKPFEVADFIRRVVHHAKTQPDAHNENHHSEPSNSRPHEKN
jgi:DNA-binding response OmpR family regulator